MTAEPRGAERGLQIGDRVRVFGLDTLPELNGLEGLVAKFYGTRPLLGHGFWYTVTCEGAIDGIWTLPEDALAVIDPAPQPSEGGTS